MFPETSSRRCLAQSLATQNKMIDLPYKDKFDEIPTIDIDEIVKYFNLEFGLEFADVPVDKFTVEDFKYVGVFQMDGRETMIWSVKTKDICVTVQPYENSYILGMGTCPYSNKNG